MQTVVRPILAEIPSDDASRPEQAAWVIFLRRMRSFGQDKRRSCDRSALASKAASGIAQADQSLVGLCYRATEACAIRSPSNTAKLRFAGLRYLS